MTSVEAGNYLWNLRGSGWRVKTLLEFEPHKRSHYDALIRVQAAFGTPALESVMEEAFAGLDPEPIDTAVCKCAERMATIPFELDWSQLGFMGCVI